MNALVSSGSLERQNWSGIARIAFHLCRCEAFVIGRDLLLFVHISEPLAGGRLLAFSDLKKQLLNLFGYRTTTALADCDAIDGTYRCDLCGCTGKEELVRDVERRSLNGPLLNRNSQFLTDLNHTVARNTWKD